MVELQCTDLTEIFDRLFYEHLNTRLISGSDEPIYQPKNSQISYHQVVFAHGFFASALHEISHWCIAGEKRRQLVDYGYWYTADGRSIEQQCEFEKVEVKPQALEWIFSKACNKTFRVSVDNLNGEFTDDKPFKRAVFQQVLTYCEGNLPARAQQFHQALCDFYQSVGSLSASSYQLSEC